MRSASCIEVLTEDLPRLGVTALEDGTLLLSAGWDHRTSGRPYRADGPTRLSGAAPSSEPATLELELAGVA